MTPRITNLALAAGLASLLGTSAAAGAQVLTVVPYARNLAGARGEDLRVLSSRDSAPANRSDLHVGINLLRSEAQAKSIWGSKGVSLLPTSTLAMGSDKAAMYTELAGVVTGAWRVGLGTTLAVSTGSDDATTAADESDTNDTKNAFQKFTAGGGSLSMTAARPILLRNGNYNTILGFAVPRVWTNIPSLGNASDVKSYGGEAGLEFQYQRFESRRKDDVDSNKMQPPFATLQVYGAVVHGSNPFYRELGRTNEKPFLYLTPTLSFIVQDKLKLGVTYFFGPRDFRDHQTLRVNFAIIPRPGTSDQ